MQMGIRKRQEDEWWVQVGPATLKLGSFQIELLNIILQDVVGREQAGRYDLFEGFVALAKKLIRLSDADLQKVLRQTQDADWVQLLRVLDDPAFQLRVLKNAGPLVARQMKADLREPAPIEEAAVQAAIERIMKVAFSLETAGRIEFMEGEPEYI